MGSTLVLVAGREAPWVTEVVDTTVHDRDGAIPGATTSQAEVIFGGGASGRCADSRWIGELAVITTEAVARSVSGPSAGALDVVGSSTIIGLRAVLCQRTRSRFPVVRGTQRRGTIW